MMLPMTWRRWLVVGLVFLALAFGGVYWRASHVWQAMLATVDAKQKELEESSNERPVLWGDATPGNAFDHYEAAMKLFETESAILKVEDGCSDVGEMIERWVQSVANKSAQRDKFLSDTQPAFALLRTGAHCRNGRRAIAWEDGFESVTLDVIEVFQVGNVAALQARSLMDRGEGLEAVRVILDVMQFGRDLYDDPCFLMSLVGGVVMFLPCKNLMLQSLDPNEVRRKGRPASILESLDSEALAVLAVGLEKLDRDPWSLGRALTAETVLLVRQIEQSAGLTGAFGGTALPLAWELGFSSRYLVGDAVDRLMHTAETLPAIDGEWLAASKSLDAIALEYQGSINPLMMMLVPQLRSVERGRRESLANLRMVRMAVAAVRGESADFADPFGGSLRSTTVKGRPRYWSAGEDGKDDGGDPNKDLVRVR